MPAFFWFLVLCTIYFSQLFFYGGVWPRGNRYDFPGMLYLPAAIVILYDMCIKLFPPLLASNRNVLALKSSLSLSLLFLIFVKGGYAPIIWRIENRVQSSREFSAQIETLSSLLKEDNKNALLIETKNVWDYEKVFSYEEFLRAYGVTNPIYLRIQGFSPETVEAGLEKSLASQLLSISLYGDTHFSPLSEFETEGVDGSCYTLNLSDSSLSNVLNKCLIE